MNHGSHARLLLARAALVGALAWTYGCSPETGRWEEARQENTVAGYEAFLTEFPDGSFADSARLGITALEFEAAAEIHTVAAYEGFLEQFPEGQFADLAHAAIDEIYPPFVTDNVLEIASVSEIVGTGKTVFSAGSKTNTIKAKIGAQVPIVGGKTCFACAEDIIIGPDLKVPVDFFEASEQQGTMRRQNMGLKAKFGSVLSTSLTIEGPVGEDEPCIVSGSEGATLKKVGRGFRLVEGEAHLLRGSAG